jgi:protein O-GlcNAc transferase
MSSAEAFKNVGNTRKAAGDLQGAAQSYRQALEIDPNYAPARYNLGVVLQEGGRFAEAESCFRRCLVLDRRDRDALFRLGLVLSAQERHDDAAAAYRDALEVDPENPLLWLQLAKAQRAQHRRQDANESATRALAIEPGFAEAHNALGVFRQEEGAFDEAVEHYRKAAALAPEDAAYVNNLGCALGLKGAFEEAIPYLERAVALEPRYVDAQANLGNVYSTLGRRELAARCFRAALELSPGDPARIADLLFESQHLCDWSRFDELCVARRRNVFTHPDARIDPFSLLSIPSTREEQLAAARSFSQHASAAVRGHQHGGFSFVRKPGARLRIGYLSADFHEHATAYLTAELFELQDRQRFEIHGYSYGPDDRSETRGRLKRAFDRFVDLSALGTAAAARAIHDDAIDILVDLKGYTAQARTGILALRPAPVQVNYLGYPATMGAQFIDYLVADPFVIPAQHEADYSEKLVLMPGSYQVNDRKRKIAATPSRRALGLPERGFVFCSFNQPYKILPETFALWMRLLAAVPDGVLWLLEYNGSALANLRKEAARRGIAPHRLVAAPPLRPEEHLGRLRAADLFLDTWPYNAHTSASDALWAGVPVLTFPGATFASRVAGSLVSAAGMPELIADSQQAYEQAALRLASAPAELAALRQRLAARRGDAALFDAPAFTRALEAAFMRMHDHWRAGRPPARIDLS